MGIMKYNMEITRKYWYLFGTSRWWA